MPRVDCTLPTVFLCVQICLSVGCSPPKATSDTTAKDSPAKDSGSGGTDLGSVDSAGNEAAGDDATVNDATGRDSTFGNDAASADVCVPTCGNRLCGDDGCQGSCGSCTGAQDICVNGNCVCSADCHGKECGSDGCGGSCGSCTGAQESCVSGVCECQGICRGDCGGDGCGGSCGSCVAPLVCDNGDCVDLCETAVCGVCDEIDISAVVGFEGNLGGVHGNGALTTAVLQWPITTELHVNFPSNPGRFTQFTISHFAGESWTIESSGVQAGMVHCWHKVGAGIYCKGWDWWGMGSGGMKGFTWPADRPVAHFLWSTQHQKRTNIKYFDSWRYTPSDNPSFDQNNVGTQLVRRDCR